ncbi:MAG: prepilin-type N-terminal cleavage/methylation domain-containing protein [Verrucomicrobiota bacterium]|nr:prepilin-type N-terminal cleavage/methylation domain-containing protein [Limisphaera sp.]MDW8381778.1 prepilin-type N-terminal cleavage/methylation domain-containing protein [Verrucomicrobiota bacterium]
MNAKRLRARFEAFTLVEAMLAVAILSLVVTAIYATWTAILRASKVGLEAAAQAQRSRMALQTLETAITSAQMSVLNAEYYGFIAQSGEDALLSFVAHLPPAFPRSGRFGDLAVRRLVFRVESGPENDRMLTLRQHPLVRELDEDEQNHPLILARGVRALQMAFWDMRTGDWTEEWLLTNQLPTLVRLTLRMNAPGGATSHQERTITRVVAIPSRGLPPPLQRPQVGAPGPANAPTPSLGPGQPPVIPAPTPVVPVPSPGTP